MEVEPFRRVVAHPLRHAAVEVDQHQVDDIDGRSLHRHFVGVGEEVASSVAPRGRFLTKSKRLKLGSLRASKNSFEVLISFFDEELGDLLRSPPFLGAELDVGGRTGGAGLVHHDNGDRVQDFVNAHPGAQAVRAGAKLRA